MKPISDYMNKRNARRRNLQEEDNTADAADNWEHEYHFDEGCDEESGMCWTSEVYNQADIDEIYTDSGFMMTGSLTEKRYDLTIEE